MRWPRDARLGERIEQRFRKWPGDDHWHHDCVWLGSDHYGDWVGQCVGGRSERPGVTFPAQSANVTLVPVHPGDWVATQFDLDHPEGVEVYIDLCWDVQWSSRERGVLTGVDMDLDVIRSRSLGTFLDDEDEFSEHAERWAYPDDVRARVAATADALLSRVDAREAPFDGRTAAAWLARLAEVVVEPGR